MYMYAILMEEQALEDLKKMPTFHQRRIVDAIRRDLTHTPTVPTRNRKALHGLVPPFEAVPPVWELRVGEWRVYYDIDEPAQEVHVRAVRPKPPHTTTEESL